MYKIIGADQKEYGPITADQMQQWIAEGRVNAQTLVWSETSGNWKPLSTFPEFATRFPAPNSPSGTPHRPATTGNNLLALWGMISGILAFPMNCCCYGLPFNIAAIVLSTIALSQIKNNPGQEGRGMALAGLVLGIASVILGIGMLIVGVAFNEDIIKWLEKIK